MPTGLSLSVVCKSVYLLFLLTTTLRPSMQSFFNPKSERNDILSEESYKFWEILTDMEIRSKVNELILTSPLIYDSENFCDGYGEFLEAHPSYFQLSYLRRNSEKATNASNNEKKEEHRVLRGCDLFVLKRNLTLCGNLKVDGRLTVVSGIDSSEMFPPTNRHMAERCILDSVPTFASFHVENASLWVIGRVQVGGEMYAKEIIADAGADIFVGMRGVREVVRVISKDFQQRVSLAPTISRQATEKKIERNSKKIFDNRKTFLGHSERQTLKIDEVSSSDCTKKESRCKKVEEEKDTIEIEFNMGKDRVSLEEAASRIHAGYLSIYKRTSIDPASWVSSQNEKLAQASEAIKMKDATKLVAMEINCPFITTDGIPLSANNMENTAMQNTNKSAHSIGDIISERIIIARGSRLFVFGNIKTASVELYGASQVNSLCGSFLSTKKSLGLLAIEASTITLGGYNSNFFSNIFLRGGSSLFSNGFIGVELEQQVSASDLYTSSGMSASYIILDNIAKIIIGNSLTVSEKVEVKESSELVVEGDFQVKVVTVFDGSVIQANGMNFVSEFVKAEANTSLLIKSPDKVEIHMGLKIDVASVVIFPYAPSVRILGVLEITGSELRVEKGSLIVEKSSFLNEAFLFVNGTFISTGFYYNATGSTESDDGIVRAVMLDTEYGFNRNATEQAIILENTQNHSISKLIPENSGDPSESANSIDNQHHNLQSTNHPGFLFFEPDEHSLSFDALKNATKPLMSSKSLDFGAQMNPAAIPSLLAIQSTIVVEEEIVLRGTFSQCASRCVIAVKGSGGLTVNEGGNFQLLKGGALMINKGNVTVDGSLSLILQSKFDVYEGSVHSLDLVAHSASHAMIHQGDVMVQQNISIMDGSSIRARRWITSRYGDILVSNASRLIGKSVGSLIGDIFCGAVSLIIAYNGSVVSQKNIVAQDRGEIEAQELLLSRKGFISVENGGKIKAHESIVAVDGEIRTTPDAQILTKGKIPFKNFHIEIPEYLKTNGNRSKKINAVNLIR